MKYLNMFRTLSVLLLVSTLCHYPSIPAHADDLDRQKKALQIISDFADNMCKDVPIKGSTNALELTGNAKMQLKGVVKKVADLGFGGAAKYQHTNFEGLLQSDLASILRENKKCRLQIWNDLKYKLGVIDESKRKPKPKPIEKKSPPIPEDALSRTGDQVATQGHPQPTQQNKIKIPNIACTMEYPIKAEEDKVFRDKHNPDIIISNNGPVSALSVSVNVKAYQYNSQKDAITRYAYQGMKNFDHAFAKVELKPFEDLRQPTMGMTGENTLTVYIINVVFHVGTEMERFEREFRFFVEHKEISNEAQFKKDSRYTHIMQKLGDVDFSTWTGIEFKATAAAEHTWFAEPKNFYGARKGEDGKVAILGLPKGQGPSKQAGYPFLELKPHPFKATGLHIKAKIVDDHVEVKTAFAVTNTGDAAALVTEDGFKIVKTIEPGQTIYYTKTVNVGRMPGNEQPLENVIKSIDESDVAFEIQFSINYRPANDKEQFLKVTGHYNVGKHKVTEVAKVKKS